MPIRKVEMAVLLAIYIYHPKPMQKWVNPLKDTALLRSTSTSVSVSRSPKKIDMINCIRNMAEATTAIPRKIVLTMALNY